MTRRPGSRGTAVGSSQISHALEAVLQKLKQSGIRASGSRLRIIEEFLGALRKITVEELTDALRARGVHVSRNTVNRTLALLVEHRLATVHRVARTQSRFEPAITGDHRDHLICTACRRVIRFRNPIIERVPAQIAEHHGFQLLAHKMDIFGICPKCAHLARPADSNGDDT